MNALMRFTQRPRINWRPRTGKGRRNLCGICHRYAGPLFDVPDTVWRHYVEPEQRRQIICLGCWHWLTETVDGSAYQTLHGGPVALWSDVWRQRHGVALRPPHAVHCTLLPGNKQHIRLGLACGCRLCERALASEHDIFEIDLDRPGEPTLGPVCRSCGEAAEGKPYSQWLDEQNRVRPQSLPEEDGTSRPPTAPPTNEA
jgi:hypothetical protein